MPNYDLIAPIRAEMQVNLKQKTVGLFLLLIAVFLLGVWLSYRATTRIANSDQSVTHTYAVLGSLDSLVRNLQRAQTSANDFIATGNDDYLKTYRETAAQIVPLVDSIATLSTRTPSHPYSISGMGRMSGAAQYPFARLLMTVDTVARDTEVADQARSRTHGPVRALVAEDFVHMQAALVDCLQSMPDVLVVATAVNGREALDKVHQLLPDLAIVDLQMPVMDGFKLLRELRRFYPKMHLVAVSGHQSPAIEQEAIHAGANAFVSKSQLPYGLVSTLEKLLSE